MKDGKVIVRGDEKTEHYLGENCYITELLNSDVHPEVSVARARVLPSEETELHALDALEIYCVLQGEGEVFIDGKSRGIIGPGDLAIIQKGLSQKIVNRGDMDLVFLCICAPRFTPEGYNSLER